LSRHVRHVGPPRPRSRDRTPTSPNEFRIPHPITGGWGLFNENASPAQSRRHCRSPSTLGAFQTPSQSDRQDLQRQPYTPPTFKRRSSGSTSPRAPPLITARQPRVFPPPPFLLESTVEQCPVPRPAMLLFRSFRPRTTPTGSTGPFPIPVTFSREKCHGPSAASPDIAVKPTARLGAFHPGNDFKTYHGHGHSPQPTAPVTVMSPARRRDRSAGKHPTAAAPQGRQPTSPAHFPGVPAITTSTVTHPDESRQPIPIHEPNV